MSEEKSEKEREHWARYKQAYHAMQSGVEFMHTKEPGETDPKHLQVGVISSMVENGALCELLVKKGVFTSEELAEQLADYMEMEVASYEKKLTQLFGRPVVLH